jgi:hypothetical protein
MSNLCIIVRWTCPRGLWPAKRSHLSALFLFFQLSERVCVQNRRQEEEEEIEYQGAVGFDQTTIVYKLCRVIARSTTGQISARPAEVSSDDPHLRWVFAPGLTVLDPTCRCMDAFRPPCENGGIWNGDGHVDEIGRFSRRNTRRKTENVVKAHPHEMSHRPYSRRVYS